MTECDSRHLIQVSSDGKVYPLSIRAASFPSSLKRGGRRSLCRGREKSRDCFIARFSERTDPIRTMKTKEQSFGSRLRRIFRRRMRPHDPMLVLNMSFFNYTDGWSRIFSKNNYARFGA
jgi:hypothetical protein